MPKIGYDSVQPTPFAGARGAMATDGSWVRTEQVLGKVVGVNLNAVAATTLFTAAVPADATGWVVTRIVKTKYSIAATTASVSFGQAATPTDYAATAVDANAATTSAQIISATAALQKFYTANVAFVANVTIPQGAPATCDIEVFGYYT